MIIITYYNPVNKTGNHLSILIYLINKYIECLMKKGLFIYFQSTPQIITEWGELFYSREDWLAENTFIECMK